MFLNVSEASIILCYAELTAELSMVGCGTCMFLM